MRVCVSTGAMKGLLSVIGRLNGILEIVWVLVMYDPCIKTRLCSWDLSYSGSVLVYLHSFLDPQRCDSSKDHGHLLNVESHTNDLTTVLIRIHLRFLATHYYFLAR